MKFYFREREIEQLSLVTSNLHTRVGAVLIYGNRKVGKTEFVKQFLTKNKGIYLSISSNNSKLQLEDISTYLRSLNQFDFYIPRFSSWYELFEFFYFIAKKENFFLAVDEFHNFDLIEKSVFSEIKKLYEIHNKESRLTLLFISSNLTSIRKNFKDPNAPLFMLNSVEIKINPFNLTNICGLYKENHSLLPIKEIIKIYLVFGGLPKYYFLIDSHNLWNKRLLEVLQSLVFQDYSPLGFEFKELILNDFSKSNKTYLAILQSIASGSSTVSEIAKDTRVQATTLMKYLNELAYIKNIITRKTPIHIENEGISKFGKYFINSYFENFWFRFIQPNQIFFELRAYDNLLSIIQSNVETYLNERFYSLIKELIFYGNKELFIKRFFPFSISKVGPIWNRKHKFEMCLISKEEKQILLFKIFPGNNAIQFDDIQLYNNAVVELKEIFKGYTLNLMVISMNRLSDEENILFHNKSIMNFTIKEILENITFKNNALAISEHLLINRTAI